MDTLNVNHCNLNTAQEKHFWAIASVLSQRGWKKKVGFVIMRFLKSFNNIDKVSVFGERYWFCRIILICGVLKASYLLSLFWCLDFIVYVIGCNIIVINTWFSSGPSNNLPNEVNRTEFQPPGTALICKKLPTNLSCREASCIPNTEGFFTAAL